MNNSIFSKRVKELRISKGLSQKSFGEMIGLSMQAVNDIENGRSNTTLERAIVIADFLNVTIDYLVGRSDDKEINNESITIISKESELLKNYRLLDDLSKGKLIERSRILLEESQLKNGITEKKNA